jgi:lysozyme
MKLRLTDFGLHFIANWEAAKGPDLKPYLCPAGVPTIAYGNTIYPSGKKVTLRDPPITKEKAWEIYLFNVGLFETDVNSLLKVYVKPMQFDMLVSFAYNLGSDIDADDIAEGLGDSTLLKIINKNPNDIRIEKEWLKWDKCNGKPLAGLTNRRQAEITNYWK